jgi:hypothetical protein
MTNKDYEFFQKNREKIIAGHENSYVVIKEAAVQGYYPTENEAFVAMKGSVLGTFIIQKCLPQKDDVIEFYSRRVVFA